MESVYRVITIRRDGVWQYWEPVLGQFTQNERSTKAIWDDMNSMRIDMGCLSSRIGSITGLSSLSKETKEELTLMSKQLDSLSFLANKLQCKILEELDNVQDTEN